MKRALQILFDTEFTGLQKDTDLISIGCITKEGNVFYGQVTDYDITKASEETQEFLKKEVEENLFSSMHELINSKLGEILIDDVNHNNICVVIDTYKNVSKRFQDWLTWIWHKNSKEYDYVAFISDVDHYDTILLIDSLTGGKDAFALPHYVCPAVEDLNYLIQMYLASEYMTLHAEDISMLPSPEFRVIDNDTNYLYDAFNANREDLVIKVLDDCMLWPYALLRGDFILKKIVDFFLDDREEFTSFLKNSKHSALFDALIIYILHRFLADEIFD